MHITTKTAVASRNTKDKEKFFVWNEAISLVHYSCLHFVALIFHNIIFQTQFQAWGVFIQSRIRACLNPKLYNIKHNIFIKFIEFFLSFHS